MKNKKIRINNNDKRGPSCLVGSLHNPGAIQQYELVPMKVLLSWGSLGSDAASVTQQYSLRTVQRYSAQDCANPSQPQDELISPKSHPSPSTNNVRCVLHKSVLHHLEIRILESVQINVNVKVIINGKNGILYNSSTRWPGQGFR